MKTLLHIDSPLRLERSPRTMLSAVRCCEPRKLARPQLVIRLHGDGTFHGFIEKSSGGT